MSFSDDPLRMVRAARFAASHASIPGPELVAAMAAMADRLAIVSVERRRAELDRLLLLDDPAPGLELLVATGLAQRVVPELDADVAAAVCASARPPSPASPPCSPGSGSRAPSRGSGRCDPPTTRSMRCAVVVAAVGPFLLRAGDGPADGGPDAEEAAVRRFAGAAGARLDDAVATLTARRPDLGEAVTATLRRLAASGDLDDLRPQLDGDEVQRLLDARAGPDRRRGPRLPPGAAVGARHDGRGGGAASPARVVGAPPGVELTGSGAAPPTARSDPVPRAPARTGDAALQSSTLLAWVSTPAPPVGCPVWAPSTTACSAMPS